MTNLNTGILPTHWSLKGKEVCLEVVPLFLGISGCSVAGHGWNVGSYRRVVPPGSRYDLVGVWFLLIYLCWGWISSLQDNVQNAWGQHKSLHVQVWDTLTCGKLWSGRWECQRCSLPFTGPCWVCSCRFIQLSWGLVEGGASSGRHAEGRHHHLLRSTLWVVQWEW